MQIEEPISGNRSDDTVVKTSIGIDLGTTNSVASFALNGEIKTIEFSGFGDILPSCVAISKTGDILVGFEALEKISDENYCVIKSAKRRIGNTKNKDEDLFDVFGKKYSPTQISALILIKIKTEAEKYLGKKVDSCVITVPAKFDDNQRNETKIAASMAGFEVKRVINEPTAAALAYGLDNNSEGIYVVYDLGGGTFDVSILSMQMGIFRVMSTSGDVNLGGDDIDFELTEYIAKKYKISINNEQVFLGVAKGIKEHLSNHDIFESEIDFFGNKIKIYITKNELEVLAEKFIAKTIHSMFDAINSAKIDKNDIKGVILVGGMSKMPIIREEIGKILDCEIYTNLDPDKIVGIGAGIKAAGKSSGFENILLDICPLSLGLETLGGVVEKIIHRNTPIPCTAIQNFTTSHDNQTGIVLNIVQGEREMSEDCRGLGKIVLKNLPQMSAGMVKIEVRFEIDVDGILSVKATEDGSGNSIVTEIKPTYGLDYEIMSDMLISSIEHSKDDILMRLLIESKEAAKMNITAIEKAISEDGDMIDSEYLTKLEAKILELEEVLSGKDREKIDELNKGLDTLATEFVEERTNKYLSKIVAGKSVNDGV